MSELDDENDPLAGVKRIARDANDAINGVADSVGLTEKVEKNPYAMVAAALGLGYVVGGGLLTPTTMRLVRLGLKVASVGPVKNKLLDAAERFVEDLVEQKKP